MIATLYLSRYGLSAFGLRRKLTLALSGRYCLLCIGDEFLKLVHWSVCIADWFLRVAQDSCAVLCVWNQEHYQDWFQETSDKGSRRADYRNYAKHQDRRGIRLMQVGMKFDAPATSDHSNLWYRIQRGLSRLSTSSTQTVRQCNRLLPKSGRGTSGYTQSCWPPYRLEPSDGDTSRMAFPVHSIIPQGRFT